MTAFIGLFVITGCGSGSSTTESTGPNYADKEFLADLGKALESRWEYNDKNVDMDQKELIANSIDIELKILDEYRNKQFKDSNLQEKAIAYINQLNEGKELLSTYGSDSFYMNWDNFYGERTKALLFLTDNFDIPIDEKYNSIVEEMRALGTEVQKNQEAEEAINSIFTNVTFEYEQKDYDGDYKTYVAVIENTSGFDIKHVNGTINLIDAEGVVLNTEYLNTDNWKNTQKHRFEFMTDKKFEKTDITVDYFELN